MTPEKIWEAMQVKLPFHDAMGYEPMDLDEFAMSQCSMKLDNVHSQATDSVPDSPERVAGWKDYLENTWQSIHFPKVDGTRWESSVLNDLGEIHLAFGDSIRAKEYFTRAMQKGHKGSGKAFDAAQNLVSMGFADPFVEAGF